LVLILWEEHRFRVFENRVLRRIFGPQLQEAGEHHIKRSFTICDQIMEDGIGWGM
jgi:hypothetical protein